MLNNIIKNLYYLIKPCSLLIVVFSLTSLSNAYAADRTINLTVGYKTVSFGGCVRKAITVNQQIPAATLHFKQGDRVTINVCNQLDKGTAIHWHGILVPWQMDGVEGVNQKAILPGCNFTYRFTLYQAGTYWYHAHAGVQEQEGLYGAFVIDPPQQPHYAYTKDYVVVLSDWSNAPAEQVLANLKKEGDYYSPRFPLQPSLVKFIHDYRKATFKERKLLVDDYKMMQQMRMSIYDISDVAYDAYLLNGHTKACPWTARVEVGDIVRLRFIGAAGSTIYRVKIPCTKMQMVHIQGNDVQPYEVNDFSIAPGETYDVLVKIQKDKPYIIYAESIDSLGKAYGVLVTHPQQCVHYQGVIPFPEPLPVTREMMATMMMSGMDHSSMGSMEKSTMDMSKRNSTHTMMGHDSQAMKSSSSHSMKMNAGTHQNMKETMSQGSMKNMSANHSTMSSNMKMSDMKTGHSMNDKKGAMLQASMDMSGAHSGSTGMSGSMKMGNRKIDHKMSMSHSMDMDMPTEPTIIGDKICFPETCCMKKESDTSHSMGNDKPKRCLDLTTTGTKYQTITAAVKTNDSSTPVSGIIKMELFGYMDQFIWFINGLPEYRAHPILIKPGKRYRIIFTNNSMMRHPMHIHGHWFILRNGHGAYDPLLHTIEVPPGATAVADVDTDASGQWFFHCHHLYHMMTGMSRVFQYETILDIAEGTKQPECYVKQQAYVNRPIVREDITMPLNCSLVNHPMAHEHGWYRATWLDVGADPFNNAQKITFKTLLGPDYHKLQLYTNDAEIKEGKIENADIDVFYWHLISQFWAVKGGVNYYYRPTRTPYWQPGIGIEGLMPYFIETDLRVYYHDGSTKLDLEFSRDTQITNNFFIRTGIRSILATKTVASDEIGAGLNQMRYIIRPYYRVTSGMNVFVEYEHESDYGAFKSILLSKGESASENTVTLGVSVLF